MERQTLDIVTIYLFSEAEERGSSMTHSMGGDQHLGLDDLTQSRASGHS
jgi:hypothetical protein